MKRFLAFACLTLLLPTAGYAENKPKANEHLPSSGVEALSQELRSLLSQEMQAVQNGMLSIIPAYVSGNWREIESTARNIKNSYLLRQNLSESQAQELHAKLPHAFIEQDQRFHALGGKLEEAARNENPAQINFYFSKMNAACLNCHKDFAVHRFPALTKKQ